MKMQRTIIALALVGLPWRGRTLAAIQADGSVALRSHRNVLGVLQTKRS
jgi:hypothetical protein